MHPAALPIRLPFFQTLEPAEPVLAVFFQTLEEVDLIFPRFGNFSADSSARMRGLTLSGTKECMG